MNRDQLALRRPGRDQVLTQLLHMRVYVCHHASEVVADVSRRFRRAAVIVDATSHLPESAWDLMRANYDVVVLDALWHEALDVLGELRGHGDETPVLMISTDVLGAFEMGADDCMGPDFAPEELVARVLALARLKAPPGEYRVEVGALRLFPARLEVQRAGRSIALSAKECCVLEVFMRHPGEVLPREFIARSCWDEPTRVTNNRIAAHVHALRRKLGPPEVILSARGRGYLLWLEPGGVQEGGGARPLQRAVLESLIAHGRPRTSAQVAAELEDQGFAFTSGDPTDTVHAMMLALLRRGLVIRSGDKSRPRFKAATDDRAGEPERWGHGS